ncbi:ABC transporter ATP-binding protein [Aureimonas sp. AU22]|uniref:ABC transporter ATP-binding protein n=1 Tax=Aureimonas sp. AU22 TaxID=1638162 RepID=UPI000785C20A|nr:ABC transporter ATP-binding protein [Aureimonas sp. AU22]
MNALSASPSAPVLAIENLSVSFERGGRRIRAVRDVSLTLAPGEVVGLVGESGSGKSVTMMSAVRLLDPRRARIEARTLQVAGHSVLDLGKRELEDLRGPTVSYIFQDPLTALNPLLTIGRQITEGLRRHRGLSREGARARAIELLGNVGIPAPDLRVRQLPHQLSGGMRQRAMIAMALALAPKLLIADEPTTALDVTVQAEIVRLVQRIQREEGMAMVWVTHDLALLARLAGRIVVMYGGRIVEDAAAERLYETPAHPYTAGLLASTSRLDIPFRDQKPIPGSPPDPGEDIRACAFAPRCSRATDECRTAVPPLRPVAKAQSVACFHPLTDDRA